MALQYNYLRQVKTPIVEETAASRYDRDYLHMGNKIVPEDLFEGTAHENDIPYAGATEMNDDDRKERQLERQPDNRQSRLYVNNETGVSATGKSSDVADVLFRGKTGSEPDPDLTDAEIRAAYEELLEMENTNLPDQSGM